MNQPGDWQQGVGITDHNPAAKQHLRRQPTSDAHKYRPSATARMDDVCVLAWYVWFYSLVPFQSPCMVITHHQSNAPILLPITP